MNCKTCEYCFEPKKIAILICEKANKPICGNSYLFANDIPAPNWCPLKKEGRA